MAEYIERTEENVLAVNAGARAIENTKKYHGACYCIDVFAADSPTIPYLKAAEVLRGFDKIPAADVAPVVHGTWEERDDGWGGTYYHCSACGEDWCIIEGTPAENNWNYCPHCGAKMD